MSGMGTPSAHKRMPVRTIPDRNHFGLARGRDGAGVTMGDGFMLSPCGPRWNRAWSVHEHRFISLSDADLIEGSMTRESFLLLAG